MKKTYDRKVFKRKLLSDRRTVTVTIRLFMILLLGFPLLTRAGTVNSTRVENREVRGKVVDEKKLPIPGVSVRLGGTSMGTATDVDGKFKLLVPADTATLVVSFIGMKTEVVKVPRLKAGEEQKELTIVLREEDVKLEDVVVTGIFTRKKESFTGSASTYSAAELKTMGTQNILQSLKTLDPAFAILEDNQFGSDPNRLPNMEIRGKSSMLGLRDELDADPNQPLFILDGFESTLAAINDLDINRVASITILKDAASTAIYGSKAANGVIVVETVKLAGSNPCPPIVLGIGVGGSFDKVAYLAKKALLRPLDVPNPDPYYAQLEQELLTAINGLGIGPQGFGGRTTCLGLAIEQMPTHVAGLPVAVNVSCHVTRRASAEL